MGVRAGFGIGVGIEVGVGVRDQTAHAYCLARAGPESWLHFTVTDSAREDYYGRPFVPGRME